jgi:SAM-dependent methyltransferase
MKYYLESEGKWIREKDVIDIPAGSGYTSGIVAALGGKVSAYDLFPQFFTAEGLTCKEADLAEQLPIDDESADMLICQEGIEHLQDQLAVLEEFNRVLKPHGKLLITTPNISHLRAKVSYLLTESDLYKRMPSNELDGLWFSDSKKMYFGHIFLINAQKLRTLTAIAGFRLNKIITVKASIGSLLLSFLYPLIVVVNSYAYFRNVYRKDEYKIADKKRVFMEIFKLNIHPVILFGKHIFWELEKDPEIKLKVFRNDEGII